MTTCSVGGLLHVKSTRTEHPAKQPLRALFADDFLQRGKKAVGGVALEICNEKQARVVELLDDSHLVGDVLAQAAAPEELEKNDVDGSLVERTIDLDDSLKESLAHCVQAQVHLVIRQEVLQLTDQSSANLFNVVQVGFCVQLNVYDSVNAVQLELVDEPGAEWGLTEIGVEGEKHTSPFVGLRNI